MKYMGNMKKLAVWAAGLLLSCVCLLGGCSDKGAEEKVKDLEFTVVGQNEIPRELMDMIEQKKAEEFRLTYTSGEDLYIAVGYGEQQTGGFSHFRSGVLPDREFNGNKDGASGTGTGKPAGSFSILSLHCY